MPTSIRVPKVSLLPNSEVGGIFRVTLFNDGDALLLWDRKEEGRFPEVTPPDSNQ